MISKGGSFVAQIVLGWILFKEDFGIYAIAISVTSLVQVLKDGGTRKIIVQKGDRRFARLCPAVFWMASGFNFATALVLLVITLPISRIYHEPKLIPIMIVLAASTLLGTPDTMYRAWLSVQHRFRDLARLQTILGLVRSGSMILLAAIGAGVMSFAWPALITVLAGWLIGRIMCGPLPIFGQLRFRLWPTLLFSSLWMFVGGAALMMLRQGPYMILGLYHEPAVLGVYFFAFQLLLQVNQMVAINFQSVLLPTLSSIGDNVQRHAGAVTRAAGGLTLIGTLIAMGLGVGIGDAVRIIWDDKWVDAIAAVQWMGLFFPFRMLQSIFEPALISRGLYRKWALLVILQSTIVLIATFIAAYTFDTAEGFAMSIGIGFVLSMVIAGGLGMHMIQVSLKKLAHSVFPIWFIGAILYVSILTIRSELGWNTSFSPPVLVLHGAISSTSFMVLFVLLARTIAPYSIHQLISTLPDRHANRIRNILKMGANTSDA